MGTLNGGHYVAYAKESDSEKWNFFNDSHVSPADTSAVVSGKNYILFYRRHGSDNENSSKDKDKDKKEEEEESKEKGKDDEKII